MTGNEGPHPRHARSIAPDDEFRGGLRLLLRGLGAD